MMELAACMGYIQAAYCPHAHATILPAYAVLSRDSCFICEIDTRARLGGPARVVVEDDTTGDEIPWDDMGGRS